MQTETKIFLYKQIKLQKNRLNWFIPATLLMLSGYYGKTARMGHKPWYSLIVVALWLIYMFIIQPVRYANNTRKIISDYIILPDNKIELSFFNFLYFSVPPKTFDISTLRIKDNLEKKK